MIENQEDDEFIAVRVQDPRVQNEGSWNSHVDYKIFLHTNSKSFTAKTSCVRRRYSEFVWLKKKLQKNSGLVPVPGLPNKSFFSFSNEDFLERRRTGLQSFLDQVLHMTVCLSDSQLHLFMQTQLPVRHIEDCVQGHTPYTVTDAILTYASSNRGFAQAQEEDLQKERGSSVVSYESMESPSPHLPSQQPNGDTLQAILETPDAADARRMVCHSERSSLQVLQQDHHLEAILQPHPPPAASFYVGSSLGEGPSLGSPPEAAPAGRIQASVEVHSPMGEAAAPDFREELEDVEEVEECLAEMQPTEEVVARAPSVPVDGVCTDSQEEEVEPQEGEQQAGVVEQQAGVVEQQEGGLVEQEVVAKQVEVEQEEEMKQEVVAEQQQQQEEVVEEVALLEPQEVENEVEKQEHGYGDSGEVVVVEEEAEKEGVHVNGTGDSGEMVEEEKEEEEEQQQQQRVNGIDDSGDHTEAVCGAGGLLDHVVSEQEEGDEEEEKETKVNYEQQVLQQTSRAEQEHDPERLLSPEEPGVEAGSASEEPLGPPDDRAGEGPHQDGACGGAEGSTVDLETETSGTALHAVYPVSQSERRADGAIREGHAPPDRSPVSQEEDLEMSVDADAQDEDTGSLVSLDGIHPTVDPEDAIRNLNGHLEESAEEVAPSTGAEDSSVCESRKTTRSVDNLFWSEAGDARPVPDEALDLCPTPGALGAGEAPELDATA
ncbi:sorting nexin-11 isoform X2 [Gadus macrocephalus]|uniref:sorting nexin-11 isoform X2 n=1 Tax=Gadus macrocephalus TaxID=80720 RepID=UPI0028CB5567|nr:sorting nexin-11 isoform X2 [Gadus macrocephalus]